MPDREYYFFFDADGMPIAVFYTISKKEAFDLFGRLYRRVWSKSVKLGITIEKESDVSEQRWIDIHHEYIARTQVKIAPVIKPVVPKLKSPEIRRMESTGLETEKYLTRM
jgi:hypothetical protein